jgi:hypothetical protein
MELAARGAYETMRVEAESMRIMSSGKAWKVGDTCLVYYPIFMNPEGKLDLMIATTWGHRIDMKRLQLKASFIPSKSVRDENMDIVKPDLLYQFSKLARLFNEGEKERRKQEVLAKDWTNLPVSTKQQALDNVEYEYNTKANMNAIRPVVSGITTTKVIEAIFVPVVNDVPLVDQANIYNQTLSQDRIAKLMHLVASNKYGPRIKEDGTYEPFIEVQYTFTSARNEKSEAGRTDPQGIVPEYLMRERYPEAWENLQQRLRTLPSNVDLIAKRNYAFRDVPEATIKQALTTFCVMQQDSLSYLTEEGLETLEKHSSIIPELRIKLTDPNIRERVDKALNEKREEAAPTIAELIKTTGAAEAENIPDEELEALNEIDGTAIDL